MTFWPWCSFRRWFLLQDVWYKRLRVASWFQGNCDVNQFFWFTPRGAREVRSTIQKSGGSTYFVFLLVVWCLPKIYSYGQVIGFLLKEHTRNTKVFKKGSNIATHVWLNDHSIDFKSAHVIDKGNFRVRKTLESWHTAITSDADNNAEQLPRQYSILLWSSD